MYALSDERVVVGCIRYVLHHSLCLGAAVLCRKKRSMMPENVYEFIAEHPFAFYIQITSTNLLVFEGRFNWADVSASQHHVEL